MMGADSNQIPNLEQLMQLGIQTARQGNRQNARMIFQQILDADAQNERAWLWMAAVAENPADRFRYLTTVLRINPNNPTAQRELEKLKKRETSNTSQVLLYGGVGLAFLLLMIALIIVFIAVR
ncbi:MAG TPA: hypothetical protein VHP83_06260 [Aggregatilineaceae bacterium]|nr:hypothetical protein [Aggregatilineaceae bacterium]